MPFSFKKRFKIWEAFGIPVYLDISTIFLMLFFLQTGDILVAVLLAIILLASIVAHELGHSLTARCFGCETRDITLTVIGGCASLESMPRKAWQELLVAAAGPAVSFVLGILLQIAANLVAPRMMYSILPLVLWGGGCINLGLGLFNLLPGFPMDGGRIFRSLARFFMNRTQATYVAMIVGRVAAVALVLLPLLGINRILIIPIGGNIILRALIAWMIWQEGYREYLLSKDDDDFRNWSQGDFNAKISPPPWER